jgi:hypothetical protein
LAYLEAFSFLAFHLAFHPAFHLHPFLTSFTSSNSYLAFLAFLRLLNHLEAFHPRLPFPCLASSASFDSYLAFLLRLLPSFTKPFSSCSTYLGRLLCLALTAI